MGLSKVRSDMWVVTVKIKYKKVTVHDKKIRSAYGSKYTCSDVQIKNRPKYNFLHGQTQPDFFQKPTWQIRIIRLWPLCESTVLTLYWARATKEKYSANSFTIYAHPIYKIPPPLPQPVPSYIQSYCRQHYLSVAWIALWASDQYQQVCCLPLVH
jgi:hypothetical protein